MRKSKRRRPCPKCSGWMLSLRDADAAAIEVEMNPIVQAVTVGEYMNAIKHRTGAAAE